MSQVTGGNQDRNKKVGEIVGKGDKNQDNKIDQKELQQIIEDVAKAYGVDPEELKKAMGEIPKNASKDDIMKKLLEILDGLDSNDKTEPLDVRKEQTDVNKDGEVDLKDAFQDYNDAKDAGFKDAEEWDKAAKEKGYKNGNEWKDGLKRGYENSKEGAQAYSQDKKDGKLKEVTKSDKEVNATMKASKNWRRRRRWRWRWRWKWKEVTFSSDNFNR